MTDGASLGSPIERSADTAGPDATAAFKLLGNETRLAILVALWEVYEPLADDNAVPFSDLRERVGTQDSGQFNYHLDQLTDHFVHSTDDGYGLTAAGQKFVRAVVAGSGIGDTHLPASELDFACNRCGARPVEVSYLNEAVHLVCSACEGFIVADEFPVGLIGHFEFAPAGLTGRSPAEVLAGSWFTQNNRLRSLLAGLCPECSGAVETSLLVCEDHDAGPQSVCAACGRRDEARVRHVCTVCKYWNAGPVQVATIDHPAIHVFYADHGIDLRNHVSDVDGFRRKWQLIWGMDHTVVSTDPVEILITVPCDGDELQLTMDGDLEVVDIDRSG
jgi:DNA-binding transcriptional ArsR family regulator/transcription elongation factor Elf1